MPPANSYPDKSDWVFVWGKTKSGLEMGNFEKKIELKKSRKNIEKHANKLSFWHFSQIYEFIIQKLKICE